MDGYSTYERFDAMVVDPSTSDYSRIISGLGESDLDIITVSGDAVYVVRKLELTLSDLTSDIYKSIEDTFINEAMVEYVESFYDDVEVNTDTLNKFDIAKIPALDDEFYQ